MILSVEAAEPVRLNSYRGELRPTLGRLPQLKVSALASALLPTGGPVGRAREGRLLAIFPLVS